MFYVHVITYLRVYLFKRRLIPVRLLSLLYLPYHSCLPLETKIDSKNNEILKNGFFYTVFHYERFRLITHVPTHKIQRDIKRQFSQRIKNFVSYIHFYRQRKGRNYSSGGDIITITITTTSTTTTTTKREKDRRKRFRKIIVDDKIKRNIVRRKGVFLTIPNFVIYTQC